jgi:outer membrane protein TolC
LPLIADHRLVLLLIAPAAMWAQAPPPQPPAEARQLPLSTREQQSGTVTASQTVDQAADAVQMRGSVRVQGAYAGSVATGDNTGTELPLRLDYALKLALRNNLGAVTESHAMQQAQGLLQSARSGLLPQVNSMVTETLEQLNLRTLGVEVNSFPPVVGPFNYFDARAARVTQALDLVRLGNLRAARENVSATRFAARNSADLVVLAVAGSYLNIIATNARIQAAAAQVRSSQAIHQQAVDRLEEGLNARIDTTRTQVQLQLDRQSLRALAAQRDRQKLQLARLIGLPAGQDFSIADDFAYAPLVQITQQQAMERAYRNRADLQSALLSVRAAGEAVKAARAERLPSLSASADYGAAGLRPTASAHGTFVVTGTLTIPLYQGGRVHGDVAQAEAALRQRQAEAADLRGQIDQDVRTAFIDLLAAADLVETTRANVDLAEDTLRQAHDRFIEGIADTVEVVQAQQSVVQAHNDYIGAVFDHNLAKVSLARAMGSAEETISQVLNRK